MLGGKKAHRGFSLIELMIAVAIAAILMAIAVPSYQQYVKKGRRSAAESCLTEMSQFMERFYTTNMAYNQTNEATPKAVELPSLTCNTVDLKDIYRFSFADTQPTATTYVIQAVAGDDQKTDGCGDLSLSNTGVRTPASPETCWP